MPVLARFLDDCWEPAAALATLRRLAGPPRDEEAQALCLRVTAGDPDGAQLLGADAAGDAAEPPGTAAYLWILWSGAPPTRAEMIALFREFPRTDEGFGP